MDTREKMVNSLCHVHVHVKGDKGFDHSTEYIKDNGVFVAPDKVLTTSHWVNYHERNPDRPNFPKTFHNINGEESRISEDVQVQYVGAHRLALVTLDKPIGEGLHTTIQSEISFNQDYANNYKDHSGWLVQDFDDVRDISYNAHATRQFNGRGLFYYLSRTCAQLTMPINRTADYDDHSEAYKAYEMRYLTLQYQASAFNVGGGDVEVPSCPIFNDHGGLLSLSFSHWNDTTVCTKPQKFARDLDQIQYELVKHAQP